jgi:hypothetical protein
MKTIFTMFDDETAAETAVAKLRDEGFTFDEINAVVKANQADNMITNENAPKLHHLLQGEQGVVLSDVGEVYAAGPIATTLVRTAAAPGAVSGGLGAALVDFSVAEDKAAVYQSAVQEGQILLWVRAEDDQAATIGNILNAN